MNNTEKSFNWHDWRAWRHPKPEAYRFRMMKDGGWSEWSDWARPEDIQFQVKRAED